MGKKVPKTEEVEKIKPLWGPEEVAKKLDVPLETFYRYIKEKRIPCFKITKRAYRFDIDEVLESLRVS